MPAARCSWLLRTARHFSMLSESTNPGHLLQDDCSRSLPHTLPLTKHGLTHHDGLWDPCFDYRMSCLHLSDSDCNSQSMLLVLICDPLQLMTPQPAVRVPPAA